MSEIAERRVLSPTSAVSTPSSSMSDPSAGSTSRNSAYTMDDLPAPVRPTMPTFIPAGTSKFSPFRTKSAFSAC